MNKQQYLKALKSALSALDKTSRDEILREIETHIEDLKDGQSIEERFGPVDELAQKYLEGEELRVPVKSKMFNLSKNILIAIGSLVVLIIALTVLFYWWVSGDDFDYSDRTAAELSNNDDWHAEPWHSELEIKIDQAKVAFYWHEEDSLRWKCKRDVSLSQDVLDIRQNNCLVFLARQSSNLDVRQSNIVLIEPLQAVDIKMMQSQLRIEENNATYRYNIAAKSSSVEELASDEHAAVVISIDATESSIDRYEYR